MKKAYFWSWLPYLAAIIIVPAVYDRLENPMMYTPPASSPPITVYASGSNYTMTNSSAAVDFSGIDPVVTLTEPGTYMIFARVRADYVGATFLASRTASFKLRRTNNTAADITNSSTSFRTNVITALTSTAQVLDLPVATYTTTNSNDIITIYADVSTLPTLGSFEVSEASIVAMKI